MALNIDMMWLWARPIVIKQGRSMSHRWLTIVFVVFTIQLRALTAGDKHMYIWLLLMPTDCHKSLCLAGCHGNASSLSSSYSLSDHSVVCPARLCPLPAVSVMRDGLETLTIHSCIRPGASRLFNSIQAMPDDYFLVALG